MQRLERCVGIVQSLSNGLSEREANDALTANVRNTRTHTVLVQMFPVIIMFTFVVVDVWSMNSPI